MGGGFTWIIETENTHAELDYQTSFDIQVLNMKKGGILQHLLEKEFLKCLFFA